MNNKYKNKGFRVLLHIVMLLLVFVSCTKDMENLNTDQKALTELDLSRDWIISGNYLPDMQASILKISPEWQYQIQQNLNADIFSGYMMTATPFAANINNITYFMMDGWNGFASSIPFNDVLNPFLRMKSIAEVDFPDYYAIALILKVIAGHRLADIFGPIPYTQYGETGAAFDSEEELYDAFFEDLTLAVNTLTTYEDADPAGDAGFIRFDRSSFAGDYARWIRLANSLRLRLAIRISGVSPTKAQTEAEAAVNHSYGVLEVADGPFEITHEFNHPLATISGGWNDILMGAPIECIMNGYSDPRRAEYFVPATDVDVTGEFKGIRQGIELTDKSEYVGFSLLNFTSTDPVLIMTAAETYFLRAEGALNGWNMGGTAQDFYEDGISASFDQYGLSDVATYLTNTDTPIPWVDPKHPGNNVDASDPNLSTITVQWNEAATDDEKLERIITQKWIAMFPEGQEAWSEFRRTGYPKLFPVVINNSGGEIPDGEFIKRLPYPSSIINPDPDAVDAAVDAYLGGSDGSYTALWWDVD